MVGVMRKVAALSARWTWLLAIQAFFGWSPEVILRASNTYLFIDDEEIEALHGLRRVFHHPKRHPENPILRGDREWEKWTVEVNGRSVLYDEETRQFRMWYGSPLIGDGAGYGELHRTAYAVSKDGVHWTKPELGQVEWAGSRRNNLIEWGRNWMRRSSVIEDRNDSDPTRRFKMLYSDLIEGRTALVKAYSIDGIHWRLNGDGQPWFRTRHNSDLLGWDARIQQYVLYVRMPGSPVSVGRSTSQDFVTWTDPELVLAPGADEEEVHFNGFATFRYGSLYLGLIRVRTRHQGVWNRAYVELAVSRDGIHWSRPSRETPFLEEAQAPAWDESMIIMPAPVVRDGKIYFYYTGQNHPFGKESLLTVQRGWVEDGKRMETAIGLATLRKDGFASLDAGAREGWVTTRPLKVTGRLLEVNADIWGELRVEILGENGEPISEFRRKDCQPVTSDSLTHIISWDGGDLGRFQDSHLRLRFWLRDGSLYSFRFR